MEESICRIELETEDTTFIAKVQTDMGGHVNIVVKDLMVYLIK